MKSNQKGAVLGFMLVMMLILSLLVFNSFSISQLELKMAAFFHKHNQVFYAAEKSLLAAENNLFQSDKISCLFPRSENNFYFERPVDWWLSNAVCHVEEDKMLLSYIIENLENAPCQKIENKPNEFVHYYRINARAFSLDKKTGVKLQSIYAKAVKDPMDCFSKNVVNIREGRQSWLEIIG